MAPDNPSLRTSGSRSGDQAWVRGSFALAGAFLLLLVGAAYRRVPAVSAGSPYGLIETCSNPAPANGEEFGNAVALPLGDQIVVAACSQTVTVDSPGPFGAVYVMSTTAGTVSQVLTRGGPAASDYFGNSVAVTGTQIVVGAPRLQAMATCC